MRNPSLTGKVAVVTGAAHGIGRAIAERLAQEGASLAVCDIDEHALRGVRDLLGSACLIARVVDVSQAHAMKQFAADVHQRAACVDILVNNAGVGLIGTFASLSLDDWQWVLATNLWGPIHGCHFFLPPMIQRNRGGHIVNIASVASYLGMPGVVGYSTSKAAVVGMSDALRADLSPHGIHVSVVCPGLVSTDLVSRGRIRAAASAGDLLAKLRRVYATQGESPTRIADDVVRTLYHPRSMVHVSMESKGLDLMRRWAPELSRRFGQTLTLFQK